MSNWRKILRNSRTGVGLQMALALMVPPKGRAATEKPPEPDRNTPDEGHPSPTAPPNLTGRWDFSRLFTVAAEPETVGDAEASVRRINDLAHNAWDMSDAARRSRESTPGDVATASAPADADQATFVPKPMTHEEIRLWLQSFNAGPYACLKYEGDVPYKETRDYVPRVMKYYEMDLKTDYDEQIKASATKYGLDPQMIKAIMKTESDFRNDCVSHAGARGLLQIMPVVWKDVKQKYDLSWDYNTQVFEPEKNIEVGCAYLAWLRYDFLPRHFAAYEPDPAAPAVLVRDKDRGVPDRESPRVVAKSDNYTPRPAATEVASADIDVKKAAAAAADKPESKAPAKPDTSEKAEKTVTAKADAKPAEPAKKSGIVISDSDSGKGKTSNGKTRVTVRGSGKAVVIAVGKGGKVSTRSKPVEQGKDEAKSKGSAVAKVVSRDDSDTQGG